MDAKECGTGFVCRAWCVIESRVEIALNSFGKDVGDGSRTQAGVSASGAAVD